MLRRCDDVASSRAARYVNRRRQALAQTFVMLPWPQQGCMGTDGCCQRQPASVVKFTQVGRHTVICRLARAVHGLPAGRAASVRECGACVRPHGLPRRPRRLPRRPATSRCRSFNQTCMQPDLQKALRRPHDAHVSSMLSVFQQSPALVTKARLSPAWRVVCKFDQEPPGCTACGFMPAQQREVLLCRYAATDVPGRAAALPSGHAATRHAARPADGHASGDLTVLTRPAYPSACIRPSVALRVVRQITPLLHCHSACQAELLLRRGPSCSMHRAMRTATAAPPALVEFRQVPACFVACFLQRLMSAAACVIAS
jgi:hypothetical protein